MNESCLGSVSRRTRSRWDAYYKRRYDEIKKKSDHENDSIGSGDRPVVDDGDELRLQSSSNESFVGKRGRGNDSCIIIDDSEDSSMAEDSDDSENSEDSIDDDDKEEEESADGLDKDYKMHAYNYVKEKGSRKVGRPSKKSDDDSDKDCKLNSDNSVKEKGSLKVGRLPKKNKVSLIRELDLINTLVNSIMKENDLANSTLKERDLLKETPALLEGNASWHNTLPLKFKFENQQSIFVEKTSQEKEIDFLFDDLEMGLWESEIGCANSFVTDDECTTSTDTDESPAAHCSRGQHLPVLDEQIGIVCKYCLKVLLEIKYVLPPLHGEPLESPKKKGVQELNNPSVDQIQFEGSTGGELESSIHSKGTVLDLIPDAGKELYPHQLEGFEFLWRNIAGDVHINKLARLSPNEGRGCIISHAPGTGKTRLTIVFLQTFMKLYPSCRPVIIAPRGMLLTWEHEFRKWRVDMKFHNLNEKKLSSEETAIAASVVDPARVHKTNTDFIRFIKLYSWMKGGSILGVGYRLFEELAGNHRKKRCNDKFKKVLLDFPGLLVLDEGHTPRNHQSLMWKALTNVTTQRRIILSGTPFQNNFSELYNTLCLVNPRFSHQILSTDSNRRFNKRRGRKRKVEARDKWAYLTSSISNDATSEDRLKKLRSMIEPFVHVHKGCILQKTLPGLRDCLIILKPTDLQSKLLQNLDRVDNFMEQVYLSSLISLHPALVAEKPEFSDHRKKLKSLESNSNAGVKTHFLINLIQLSVRLHEKVLVFSEFIDPLHHIQKLLKHHLSWNQGREVIYMDGDLSLKQRQRLINSFNNKKSEAKVLLASQRACSEGINLVGASRVVLLDVVWNPSVERQAICRAYRLGQEKVVYVYHLVTSVEVKKYARQAEKERIAELIFCPGGESKTTPSGNGNNVVLSEDKVLETMIGQQSLSSMVERIVHQPKDSDLVNSFGFVDLK